jgi:Dolichyl-phosphate-mannose-protein mannosyltransferase
VHTSTGGDSLQALDGRSDLSLIPPDTGSEALGTAGELRVCTRLLWTWLIVRTSLWTLLAWTESNGRLDLLEWLAWGHQWQLGYPAHPPFPAWLAAAIHNLTPGSLVGVYLLSNLAIAFTLWCVWRVAREIVVPGLALISAMCLEGYLFFTLESPEYSNNVILCATWMATVLSLQQALKSNTLRWWLGLGVSVGLSALTKYSIGFLVVPLIVFTIVERGTRIIWRRKEVYLAAGVALLIFTPHLVWMRATNFMTIQYALDRAAGYRHWYHRLLFPVVFLLDQVWRFLPVLLIIAPLILPRRGGSSNHRCVSSPFSSLRVPGSHPALARNIVRIRFQYARYLGRAALEFAGCFPPGSKSQSRH